MRIRGEWLGPTTARLLLLAALIGLGAVSVLTRGTRWLGSWKLALDETTGSIFLIGPVAAGIACAVYVRLRHSQVDDMLAQSARPWRGWLAPAVSVWALATSAVVVIGLCITGAATAAGSTAYPGLAWVVLPALLVLGAEVAIGALVGSQVQRYWAVPWVAVGTFLLFLLTRFGMIPVVFDTGPTSGQLIGETFSAPWLGFQAVAALGIAVAAAAASHRDLFLLTSLPVKVGTGVVAAVALVALVAVRPPTDRYEAAPTTADVCSDGEPVVCMTEDGHRPLDDLAARMISVGRPLLDARATLPSTFVPFESSTAHDPGVGLLVLFDDDELARTVDDAAAARSLATPARCAAFFDDDPRALGKDYFPVYNLLVRWLLVQSGDEPRPEDGSLAAWWAQPVEQQYPWVRATYDDLGQCRLSELALPSADDVGAR